MQQEKEFSYKDFYSMQLCKPRKTEQAEMKEIEEHLQELISQNDFFSIEAIRRLSAVLAGQDTKAGYRLLFLMEDYFRMGEREQGILSAISNGLTHKPVNHKSTKGGN